MESKRTTRSQSHKREISSSTSPTEPPKSKQKTKNTPKSSSKPKPPTKSKEKTQISIPKSVYLVIVERRPAYADGYTDVDGVYSSITDANNAVKRLVAADGEYCGGEDVERGIEEDGRAFWRSPDIGEGDGAEIEIKKMKLHLPSGKPERDWPEGEELGDEDEDGDGNESEEDEDE